jgi:hypothetical protein
MEGRYLTATELNFRLLAGAVRMREDEKRWHQECFGDLQVPFGRHQWDNIEVLARYWIQNDMLPEAHVLYNPHH